MVWQLTNTKALVTGSTAGTGSAIASLLAQESATVVVNPHSLRRVEHAVQGIRTARNPARVMGVPTDVGTMEGAKRPGSKRSSSPPPSPPRSGGRLRGRRKGLRWWFLCAAHAGRPPPGRPCGWTAGWSGPLRDWPSVSPSEGAVHTASTSPRFSI
jgi:hypothetical protein